MIEPSQKDSIMTSAVGTSHYNNFETQFLCSSHQNGGDRLNTARKVGLYCAGIIGTVGIAVTSPIMIVGAGLGFGLGAVRDVIDPQRPIEVGSNAYIEPFSLYRECYFMYGGAIGSLGSLPLLAFAIKNIKAIQA